MRGYYLTPKSVRDKKALQEQGLSAEALEEGLPAAYFMGPLNRAAYIAAASRLPNSHKVGDVTVQVTPHKVWGFVFTVSKGGKQVARLRRRYMTISACWQRCIEAARRRHGR